MQEIINEIAEINSIIGAPKITHAVECLLNENPKSIQVAILGQFKSGKSSFINSLIGENILPVGVIPVTAIVTQLKYGTVPRLMIKFNDGNEVVTTLENLSLYVTEKLNPGNTKKISHAIIEHPKLSAFKKITLVDTPGLNSFYKHNTEATLQWIPYVGSALICISPERPLSEDDLNLIKGISPYCTEISLVITKTDLFNPDDLSEIKLFILQSVGQLTKRIFSLFEYSIYENTREYKACLIENIIDSKNRDFDRKFDEIIKYKLNNIIERSTVYAELAMQANLKREHEKEAILEVLTEIKENRRLHEKEMLLYSTAIKNELRTRLDAIILPYIHPVIQEISEIFKEEYPLWKGTLYRATRIFEQWLKEKLAEEISKTDNGSFSGVNDLLKEPLKYFEYSSIQFRNRINEKINRLFDVTMPCSLWQIDFTGIVNSDIAIYRIFDSNIDTLLFFMPMKIVSPLFYKHFYNQIPLEVEKNIQRYISDLNEKITRTIDDMHKQSLEYINNEISYIEGILLNEKTNLPELENSLIRLDKLRTQLEEENRAFKHNKQD